MEQSSDIFVGLDVSKMKISVAVGESGRGGEVRFRGGIGSTPAAAVGLVKKLSPSGARLRFCCEAGPTGYGLQCQILATGHDCMVVAPSLIPRRPGERVKTNRRDAVSLPNCIELAN
jgi:transposase